MDKLEIRDERRESRPVIARLVEQGAFFEYNKTLYRRENWSREEREMINVGFYTVIAINQETGSLCVFRECVEELSHKTVVTPVRVVLTMVD